MIDPKDALRVVSSDIDAASADELKQAVTKDISVSSNINVNRPSDIKLPLSAYLASALTGLDKDQRSLIFHLSDIISTICEKNGISLYEPRKKTDPVHHPEVHDKEVFATDRKGVLSSDLLIYLSHFPSTGAGQELDFAYGAMLPIIVISRAEDTVSRMVTGIPTFNVQIEYSEPEDMRTQLDDCLDTIKPLLEERKLAYSEYDVNIVGNRIRELRTQLGLSRRNIVDSIFTITEEELEKLEENTDKISNPSLVQLRQVAFVLKTTVADLVEPNMGGRVISFLNHWLEGRQAARGYSSISDEDTRKIMRRVLLRVVDSLEK